MDHHRQPARQPAGVLYRLHGRGEQNLTSGTWKNPGGGKVNILAVTLNGPGATPIGGHAITGGLDSSDPTIVANAPSITLTQSDGTSTVLYLFGGPDTGAWYGPTRGTATGNVNMVAGSLRLLGHQRARLI